MIDERDRTISVALRTLRDELPPADWGAVIALATAPSPAPEDGVWVDGAVPVAAERPRRRSVRIGALVAVAVLALAVVVAGLQGRRSPRPDTSGSTPPPVASADPRAAFSQIFARPPSTDPKVLALTSSFAEHLPDGSKVDADAPREMPSDLGNPLYMVAGSKAVCFVARSTGAGCGRLQDVADPATPSLWLGTAADDTLVMVALVPDSVARMTVLTADQKTVDLKVAGNVASGRIGDRPARVLTTLRDGTTLRYDYDLTFPPDETLPPTKAMPRSGDRSRAFVRDNPALVAAVGPAVVADGTVELPKAVQEKIADLNRDLARCLGRSQPDPDRLPADPDGSLAKACPAEMTAIDAYAASRELNAAGIVRYLTADALEQCGRLGRPSDGTPAPPDGATTVTPPAELRCRQAVIGHLPPF